MVQLENEKNERRNGRPARVFSARDHPFRTYFSYPIVRELFPDQNVQLVNEKTNDAMVARPRPPALFLARDHLSRTSFSDPIVRALSPDPMAQLVIEKTNEEQPGRSVSINTRVVTSKKYSRARDGASKCHQRRCRCGGAEHLPQMSARTRARAFAHARASACQRALARVRLLHRARGRTRVVCVCAWHARARHGGRATARAYGCASSRGGVLARAGGVLERSHEHAPACDNGRTWL